MSETHQAKPGRCQVCHSPDRQRIEMLHVSGRGIDDLAKEFGCQRDSIWRHMTKHVTQETKVSYLCGPIKLGELANLAADENKSVIEYLSILRSILFGALDRSARQNKAFEVSRIGKNVLDVLREIGRLTGELSSFASQNISFINNQTTILNSPIVAELQTELLQTLAPYDDARRAVIAMFARLDERHRNPDMKLIEAEPISRSEAIKRGQAAKREREEAMHVG
jgi:hypothetical protein